jgi:phage tail-like protein
MRGIIPGLGAPYPIGGLLPAVYQDDEFTMRWTEGLDEVLAPVISVLDCLGAYVDPLLAPADFLPWLAGWFGTALDENWPLARQRAAIARSAGLYRQQGTLPGLRGLIEMVTGGEAEVTDSGGTSWSQVPSSPLPGEEGARVTVRVTVSDPARVDVAALDELLAAVKPAHVTHELEVSGP